MTTKEKIKYYIDSKGISKNKFYTITGLSTSFLDSGNTIGVDKAKIIIEKFPDLCWQGGTRIKQPERFILTPDYPIKDAARPHNLDTTATTKRITKLDILLFHAFAE